MKLWWPAFERNTKNCMIRDTVVALMNDEAGSKYDWAGWKAFGDWAWEKMPHEDQDWVSQAVAHHKKPWPLGGPICQPPVAKVPPTSQLDRLLLAYKQRIEQRVQAYIESARGHFSLHPVVLMQAIQEGPIHVMDAENLKPLTLEASNAHDDEDDEGCACQD